MDSHYLEKVRFLIVEDNVFLRHLVRLVLSVLGASDIKEAGDGADALQVLKTFEPDIIILDWEMRPMDGLDFAKRVRQPDAPYPYVPIIMLSAYSEHERVITARDAGINEFVVKPFTANALYDRIFTIIERPRPFVNSTGYFGPDRRRRNVGAPGEERRQGDGAKKKSETQSAGTGGT